MKTITILALHLGHGGIERYISLLSKMLDRDYKINIISTYKFPLSPVYDFSDSVDITYLIDDYPDKVSIKKLFREKHYIHVVLELIHRIKLKRMVKKKNIESIKNISSDYVITTRIFHHQLVHKYLKNKSVVKIATEHNYHNNDQKYIQDLIFSVSNFDYVVACTDELYDFYYDKIPNLVKIYNGIELSDKISKLNNKKIISVGRLSPEKGYLDLIDVMNLIHKKDNDIHLTICGDGYQRSLVEQKIQEYGLDEFITLTGFLNGKDLEDEYLNSSLYVLPSISEAFGLVLLEAMNYGLPCIAFSRASGARNLLKNDIGILIDDSDKEEMAKKIVRLFKNNKKMKEYQMKSIENVKKYSLDNMYGEWKKILK